METGGVQSGFVNAGIAARESVVEVPAAWLARVEEFGSGKRQQRQQGRSARQRLAQLLPNGEVVAASQQELARLVGFVNPDLEIGSQIWGALNLVDDGAVGVVCEEGPWVVLDEIPDVGRLQIDVGQVEGVARQGGFPRLPRPHQGHDGVLLKGSDGRLGQASWNHGRQCSAEFMQFPSLSDKLHERLSAVQSA